MTALMAKDRPAKCPSGFTLIELAVVIFIMALMVTLVTPFVASLGDAALKREARRLAGRATFLFTSAVTQKRVFRLNFDLQNNIYFVTFLDPYALKPQFLPYRRLGGAPVKLSPGVKIRDISVGRPQQGRGSIVSCDFYPQGVTDGAVIHLTSSRNQVLTIIIPPLTGQVRIVQGDAPARVLMYAAAAP